MTHGLQESSCDIPKLCPICTRADGRVLFRLHRYNSKSVRRSREERKWGTRNNLIHQCMPKELLVRACWLVHAGSCMLARACWLVHAGSYMLARTSWRACTTQRYDTIGRKKRSRHQLQPRLDVSLEGSIVDGVKSVSESTTVLASEYATRTRLYLVGEYQAQLSLRHGLACTRFKAGNINIRGSGVLRDLDKRARKSLTLPNS